MMDTTLVTSLISAVVAVVSCLINNNIQRAKENHALEMKMADVKSEIKQEMAVVRTELKNVYEQQAKYNNVIERTFNLEKMAIQLNDAQKSLDERLDRMEKHG